MRRLLVGLSLVFAFSVFTHNAYALSNNVSGVSFEKSIIRWLKNGVGYTQTVTSIDFQAACTSMSADPGVTACERYGMYSSVGNNAQLIAHRGYFNSATQTPVYSIRWKGLTGYEFGDYMRDATYGSYENVYTYNPPYSVFEPQGGYLDWTFVGQNNSSTYSNGQRWYPDASYLVSELRARFGYYGQVEKPYMVQFDITWLIEVE